MKKATPQNIKQFVQQQFAHVATHYSTSQVHAGGEDLLTIVNHAKVSADAIILDAGCGAGHTTIALASYVQTVIAYDFTHAMLEQVRQLVANRNMKNIILQEGDVESLPFADHTFDMIVSRYSAHHWNQPEKALLEFARTLKRCGQLILSDVVAPEVYAQDTFLQTLELLRDPSHVRDYSVSQWLHMFESAGFVAEILLQFDVRLHFQNWLDRMATPELNRQMIRSLFDGASRDIRGVFLLHGEGKDEFVIPGAVIKGRLIE